MHMKKMTKHNPFHQTIYSIRRFSLFFILTFVLFSSGCGTGTEKNPPSGETTVSGSTQSGAENTGETSSLPETPEETKTPDTELPPGNDTQVPSAILSNKESIEDTGVFWYIPNAEIESGLQQTASLYQGNLLLSGTAASSAVSGPGSSHTYLKLISLETGEVLRKAEFAGIEFADVQVCGEMISLADWSDGEVLLLDHELNVVSEHKVQGDYSTTYVSSDASKIYTFTSEQGIRIMDLSSGETEVQLENAVYLYVSSRSDSAVTFSYTDRDTQLNNYGVMDLDTGEVQTIPFAGSFFRVEYADGSWLAGVEGEINRYYLGMTERPNIFSPVNESGNLSLLSGPARLMSTAYDENGTPELSLYNMDGSFLSGGKVNIPGIFLMYKPIWSEADGGYFLLGTGPEGKDLLLFWDLSTPRSGRDLQPQSGDWGEVPEGTVVSQELYDRADALTEKYGVEILIAERAGEDFGDYLVEQEFYEVNIETALDGVERVFSAYPEGFLPQLYYSNIREIELHLVGHLNKTDLPEGEVNGFTSFDGFAQEQSGKAVIVMDITLVGSMEQTLHHELFHLIDNKLTFDAGIRGESDYSEEKWMSLNPEGFEYAWDSSELPEEIFNEEYDVWFVELYSRTFPREDRATIMEYAMVGAEWMFVAAPQRQAKLEYLSECIRDAFDTTGWPEKTVWEDALERSFLIGS